MDCSSLLDSLSGSFSYNDTNDTTLEIWLNEDKKIDAPSKEQSLSSLFVSDEFAPPIPFNWPKYDKLKLYSDNGGDVVNLIRNSCQKLSENAQYIDINYDKISSYAQSLNREEIESLFSPHTWNYQQSSDKQISISSEKDIINVSCYFIILQFGSGFRRTLHKYCDGRGASVTIGVGIQNMYKKYPSLDCKSLSNINYEEIGKLFEINYSKSLPLKSLCHMISKCINECVDVLKSKGFNDFASYIYHLIDISYIKSQTQTPDLYGLECIDFYVDNNDNKLGLTLAPTKSNIVKRCVLIDIDDKNKNQDRFKVLNENLFSAFIYSINDEICYNHKFDEIISKLKTLCSKKGIIQIKFGLNLQNEGNVIDELLFNLINDFSSLNDQYFYKSLSLQIYLFKRAQLIVMDLYNNLYQKNKIFNFKNINIKMTAVIDNVVPFVLMKDDIIKIKDKYKQEFEQNINQQKILLSSDLECEIRACAIWAIELILKQRTQKDINVAKLTYYLWKKGKFPDYRKCERHYTRDTIFY